jgi:hypothetical protein
MKLSNIVLLFFASLILSGCNLEELPEATTTKGPIFESENGLILYTNSFYNIINGKNLHRADAMSDYLCRNSSPAFITPGNFSSDVSSGWGWNDLRNINYFLENCNNPKIPVAVRNNYIGIARFFRAWFYFEKVKRFGDVPWIGKTLNVDDKDILFKGRDSRKLIIDSIQLGHYNRL